MTDNIKRDLREIRVSRVDQNGSESYPMAGVGISGDESSELWRKQII